MRQHDIFAMQCDIPSCIDFLSLHLVAWPERQPTVLGVECGCRFHGLASSSVCEGHVLTLFQSFRPRSLIVSLLWCVYNAVPPALMLYYAGFKEHGLVEVCRVASLLTALTAAGEGLSKLTSLSWHSYPQCWSFRASAAIREFNLSCNP